MPHPLSPVWKNSPSTAQPPMSGRPSAVHVYWPAATLTSAPVSRSAMAVQKGAARLAASMTTAGKVQSVGTRHRRPT